MLLRRRHRNMAIGRQKGYREVRQRNGLTGRYRTNNLWRYDDHQFCIRPGLCSGLEEFTEDWNVPDEWNLTERRVFAIIEKSADCEALAFG